MLAGRTKKHSTPAVNSPTIEQAHELVYKLLDRITGLEDRLKRQLAERDEELAILQKAATYLREAPEMKYVFIEKH